MSNRGFTSSIRRHAALALALFAFIGMPALALAVDVGEPPPEINLPDLSGKKISLAALKGKVVIVDFWASWCAPCRQSFPALDDLSRRLGAEGFVVVGINLDEERADADRFLAERPVSFAIVFDPEATTPESYGLKTMPSSFLVGRDGVVRSVHSGFRKGDGERLEAEVRALLAEPAPE